MELGGGIESAQTYVGLALLNGGIAVRVRDLGLLAQSCGDAAVNEAEDRDGAEGDGNDGPVDGQWLGRWKIVRIPPLTRSYQEQEWRP